MNTGLAFFYYPEYREKSFQCDIFEIPADFVPEDQSAKTIGHIGASVENQLVTSSDVHSRPSAGRHNAYGQEGTRETHDSYTIVNIDRFLKNTKSSRMRTSSSPQSNTTEL